MLLRWSVGSLLKAETAAVSEEYTKLYELVQNARPTKSVRNGYVWLFLRKPAEN